MTQDSDVALAGEPISAETESRSYTLSTPFDLCFNDCRSVLAATLRENFPASEVFVQGTNDIEILTNGIDSVWIEEGWIDYSRVCMKSYLPMKIWRS